MDDECDTFTINFFKNPDIQQSRLWTLSEMSSDDFTFTITELLTNARRLNIDERLITLFNRRYNKFMEDKAKAIKYAERLKELHKIYKLWGTYLMANEVFTNEEKQKWLIRTASKITDNADMDEFEKIYAEMIEDANISQEVLTKISNRYNNYISNGCKFDDEI
jgi:uncharacterized protein (DUF1778 family)